MSYQVVCPQGRSTQLTKRGAPRLDTLDGKTIGALSNYQFHAAITFPVIRKALAKRYPTLKFISYEAFGNIDDPNHETAVNRALPDKLKEYQCDAVITGNGG